MRSLLSLSVEGLRVVVIFVRMPWDEDRPDEGAAAVRSVLAGPAARWPAEWHSIKWGRDAPPEYAGSSWRAAEG
jgi:hypothetical protein